MEDVFCSAAATFSSTIFKATKCSQYGLLEVITAIGDQSPIIDTNNYKIYQAGEKNTPDCHVVFSNHLTDSRVVINSILQ